MPMLAKTRATSAARTALGIMAALALGACETAPTIAADAGIEDAAIPADAHVPEITDAQLTDDGDAGPTAPDEGRTLHPIRPILLVDTRTEGSCGALAPLDDHDALEVDLAACGVALPPGTGSVALSWTVIPRDPAATFKVRVAAPASIDDAYSARVGPLDDRTHAGLVALDGGGAIRVEVWGEGTADVLLELTALLAPAADEARGVVMLARPIRVYSARSDEPGVWHGPARAGVDETLSLDEVAEALGALPADVVGLVGVAHVAPAGPCEPGSYVALGPARPEGDTEGLARIATCGPVSGSSSRSSTAFIVGADASRQLVLRAEGADAAVDLDIVGYLVPHREGAALYRPLVPPVATQLAVTGTGVRVGGAPSGAIAISGQLAADTSGWGSLAVDARGELEGSRGPFASLSLRGDAPSSVAFTTRVDDAGAFVVTADTHARLLLTIDGYWSIDSDTP